MPSPAAMQFLTRTRKSPLAFHWQASDGLDYQGRLVARTGQIATFTRAGTSNAATATDSTGRIYTPGDNTPRFTYRYNAATGAYDGPYLLREGAATNLLTYGRLLSNAAWTATNVTVAATTGADGVASAGSRLTATGANGTVIRAAALVHASAAYAGSFVAKRITGTGNIDLTLDNGAAWTTVTLTSAYTQLFKTQTLANSQFGIRLVTSGDVIDVDFCQDEKGSVPSSPIGTAATAITRAADLWSFPWSRNPEAGTWYVDAIDLKFGGAVTAEYVLNVSKNPPTNQQLVVGAVPFVAQLQATSGNSTSAAVATTAFGNRVELRAFLTTSGSNVVTTLGQSINGGVEAVAVAGASQTLDAIWSSPTLVQIGSRTDGGGTSSANLAIRSIGYVPRVATMAEMRDLVG